MLSRVITKYVRVLKENPGWGRRTVVVVGGESIAASLPWSCKRAVGTEAVINPTKKFCHPPPWQKESKGGGELW